MIFDGLGDHFGRHFDIKIASKSRLKNQSDFGSILDGFWFPFWAHVDPILVPFTHGPDAGVAGPGTARPSKTFPSGLQGTRKTL